MKLTFNGKNITSSGQLGREFEKSVRLAMDAQVKAAAPPGVKVRKTSQGYVAEGDANAIEKMADRLGK
ncbi:hypothetical protein [Sphingomonas montana]|uniref:hypothetical protein n=1 Tax=Sphingomonas montana TaxID=1843236 RepID=UPI00101ADC58|nr:hypothetical protein [Sphingomonas montana]